jgi:hypothetical protein
MYRDDSLGARSEEKIARMVEVRSQRQKRLTATSEPLQLHVVLDEVALRRVVGGREIMRAQINHLILLSETQSVTVQIVPFDRGGGYEAMLGAFTILGFPFDTDLGIVYKERRAGADFFDSFVEINDHSLLFGHLSEKLALPEIESLKVLRDAAHG